MADFESPLDKIIREARERGEFDNLPGKGKPIQWEDESLVPEDQRLANRLLRNNGMTLDWIELGKELDILYDELRDMIELARRARSEGRMSDEDWQVAAEVFAGKIQELNRRIMGYNIRVPHGRFERPFFPVDPDIQQSLD